MNLHEYQSKKIFADYGIPVPRGTVASTPDEAVAAAQGLGGPVWGITMGQLLSLPMVAIGLGFVLWALRRR